MKLGNLFLNDNLEIKLGDFGLATRVEIEGERKRWVQHVLVLCIVDTLLERSWAENSKKVLLDPVSMYCTVDPIGRGAKLCLSTLTLKNRAHLDT